MKFKATRDIIKGEIIVQKGICQSNADNLIASGFINMPVPNPFDAASIEIELDPQDPLFSLKLELIGQSTNQFRYLLYQDF